MTGPALIYIMGVGRSGSTLLERLLASAPGAAGMGEAHCLWRLPLDSLTCSCGAAGPECPVWRETLARAGLRLDDLPDIAALETEAIRHRRILRRALSIQRFADDPSVHRFLKIQNALFTSFAEVSGASLLIDSSKAAPRAWALAAWPQTRIVWITRGSKAVSASWRNRKHDPSLGAAMPVKSAAALTRERLVTSVSAGLLAQRTGVARIRCEDLADDPQAALRASLGPGISGAVAWRGDRAFAPDPDYHSLSGNPDRFTDGDIAIRPDAATDERIAA